MSMISEALDFMAEEAAPNIEESIVYSDGSHTVGLGAIVLPTKQPDFSILGMVQGSMVALQAAPENQDRDFSVLAAKLILNGVTVLPQSGDLITATLDGTARIYEVSTPLSGPYPWEYTDAERRLRIHTKFLRAA
jgi:hypothetical protein